MIYLQKKLNLNHITKNEDLGLVRSLKKELDYFLFKTFDHCDYLSANSFLNLNQEDRIYSFYHKKLRLFCSLYEQDYNTTREIMDSFYKEVLSNELNRLKLIEATCDAFRHFSEDVLLQEKQALILVESHFSNKEIKKNFKTSEIRDLIIYFHDNQIVLELITLHLYNSQHLLLSIELSEYIHQKYKVFKLAKLRDIINREDWLEENKVNLNEMDEIEPTSNQDTTGILQIESLEKVSDHLLSDEIKEHINLFDFSKKNLGLKESYENLELKSFIFENPLGSRTKMIDFLIIGNHVNELHQFIKGSDSLGDLFKVCEFFFKESQRAKLGSTIELIRLSKELSSQEMIYINQLKNSFPQGDK